MPELSGVDDCLEFRAAIDRLLERSFGLGLAGRQEIPSALPSSGIMIGAPPSAADGIHGRDGRQREAMARHTGETVGAPNAAPQVESVPPAADRSI